MILLASSLWPHDQAHHHVQSRWPSVPLVITFRTNDPMIRPVVMFKANDPIIMPAITFGVNNPTIVLAIVSKASHPVIRSVMIFNASTQGFMPGTISGPWELTIQWSESLSFHLWSQHFVDNTHTHTEETVNPGETTQRVMSLEDNAGFHTRNQHQRTSGNNPGFHTRNQQTSGFTKVSFMAFNTFLIWLV